MTYTHASETELYAGGIVNTQQVNITVDCANRNDKLRCYADNSTSG